MNKKYVFFVALAMVSVFALSFNNSVQAQSTVTPVAVCPVGYTCTPIQVECPVGYTCVPVQTDPNCPVGYTCQPTSPILSTTTTVQVSDATAVVKGTPSLSLAYDTQRKESSLVATFDVVVNGNSTGINLGYGANVSFTDPSNPKSTMNSSGTLTPTSPVNYTDQSINGQIYYGVPPGESRTFRVVATAKPSQMFAGTYYASLNFFYGMVGNSTLDNSNYVYLPVKANRTNNKTIVGETSPYISAISPTTPITPGQTVTLTGKRLTNTVLNIDGVAYAIPLTPINSFFGVNTGVSFKMPTLLNGRHNLQLSSKTTGFSNIVWFESKGGRDISTTTSSIVASLDPTSPQTSTVQISQTSPTPNVVLAVFDLKSQGKPSTLQQLSVGIPTYSPNLKGSQPGTLFTNIFIRVGGQVYAETSMVGDIVTFSNLQVALPADVSVPVTVYVSVAQNTNNFFDGSNASVNLPLTGIIATDSNYNNVPVNQGPIVGLLSGSTITFVSNATNSVRVSNASATLGTGLVGTANGLISAYPVTFKFTLSAGDSSIYLGKVPAHTNALVFNGKDGALIPDIQIMSVEISSTGDTSDAFIISAGTSRAFTYQGTIVSPGITGNYISQIVGIQYGTNPYSLTANTITIGLENLRVSMFFGGNPIQLPSLSVTPLSVTSGQKVTFNYVIPNNATSMKLFISCPTGVSMPYGSGGNENCNTPIIWSPSFPTSSIFTAINKASVTQKVTAELSVTYPDGSGGGINVYFTITPGSTNLPPVITGGTSPVSLKVGEVGKWSVDAYDPENGPLSYSIDWGETNICQVGFVCNTLSSQAKTFTQTSTFTHSYASAGRYTVIITVKDNTGLTAEKSSTVEVGSGTTLPPVVKAYFTATPAGYGNLHKVVFNWSASNAKSCRGSLNGRTILVDQSPTGSYTATVNLDGSTVIISCEGPGGIGEEKLILVKTSVATTTIMEVKSTSVTSAIWDAIKGLFQF